MSPELTSLLAAIHDKDAAIQGVRAKVEAADAVLTAHIGELQAVEEQLNDMRREAWELFGKEHMPAPSKFDAYRYRR